MVIIGKSFYFEAAHQLPDSEEYGQCRNLHGHTYQLIVEIAGEIDDAGWVMNFKELSKYVRKVIIDKFDHSNLNDFFELPTAELMLLSMAKDLKMILPSHVKVHSLQLFEGKENYAKILY